MRAAVVALVFSAGCVAEDARCAPEHVVMSESVVGTQIARVGNRIAWNDDRSQIRLGDIDNSSGTGVTADVYAFGPGMVVDGDRVLWTAVLPGIEDSALFATELYGETTMLATFPGCTSPRAIALDTHWWVAFGDCDSGPNVFVGTGSTQTATHTVSGIVDLAPGWAIIAGTALGLSPTESSVVLRELALPDVAPGQAVLLDDTLFVTMNDGLWALPTDGTEPTRLGRYLPVPGDLVVDQEAAYLLSFSDGDPSLLRVPRAGGDAEVIAEHLGGNVITLAQDDTHVYWVSRGRPAQDGIWRIAKCR